MVRLQAHVRRPPAYLVDRFYTPMARVAATWATVARALARYGYTLEISSWWRDFVPAGGATYSQHFVGTAIDGLVPGLTRAQLLPIVVRAAKLNGLPAAAVPLKASAESGRSVHVQGLPVGTVQTLVRQQPDLFRTAASFVGPPRPVG